MTLTKEHLALSASTIDRPRPRPPLVERRWVGVAAPLALVVVILVAWEITSKFVNPVLISSPPKAAHALFEAFRRGSIADAVGVSLRELFIGLGIGVVGGLLLGVLIGRYRLFDAVASPFVNTAIATPLPILIPLMILWVGVTVKARILFIAISTLIPVLLNTAGGVRNVSQGYADVGRSLGLSERQTVWKIVAPATAPYIFAGLRLGLAHSVIAMIIVEMEVSQVGVGFLLSQYGASLDMSSLISVTLLVCLLGVALVGILLGIERRWFAWIRAAR